MVYVAAVLAEAPTSDSTFDHLALLTRRERVQMALLAVVLIGLAVFVSFKLAQSVPPRRIVLASGPEFGVYHEYAKRYTALLAKEGVRVEERMTSGAAENLRLLLDPKSGVDIAFLQGGVADSSSADSLVMLATLYYEPLWVFYKARQPLSQLTELEGKRIAIGVPGSGTRALANEILAANGLALGERGTAILPIGGEEALAALRSGEADAALFVGGAGTPLIQRALRDPTIRLMSLSDVDVYPRRFSFINRLTLPKGTVDLAFGIPSQSTSLIATKAMLAARDDFHPALINLLVDAARAIHGRQGYFEAAGEFPGTEPLDLPVSPYADQHKRFGGSFLYQYLPFWLAALLERTIVILLPLLVVLIPLLNLLPQFMSWRTRSRIYRWYGELAMLEREVNAAGGASRRDKWLSDLDRIEHGVGGLRLPPKFASEAYTLREHIGLVRRAVMDKVEGTAQGST